MTAIPVAVVMFAMLLPAQTAFGASSEPSPWEASTDATTQTRFIPVELWTGSEWDGGKELNLSKAQLRFGERQNKAIKGPMEWRHPVTGETLLVYERTNQQRGGVKAQLFAMNADKTGLGRVLDVRDDLGTRTFSGGLKFPLGYWKQGETKQVSETRYEGSRVDTRIEAISIKQLDFTFKGTPHCLEFEWLYKESRRSKIIDQQTYTYCPHQGMVRQVKQ